MNIQDDRTPEQRNTHPHLVIGTDSFMSGWGQAKGVKSYAAWACKPEHLTKVLAWVLSRNDMKRVRTTYGEYHPRGSGHCHIYVVDDKHPAIS